VQRGAGSATTPAARPRRAGGWGPARQRWACPGKLDPAGVRVLAGLLDGVGPDGARLVDPVLRAYPAGRVPALPIVTAARAAAADAGMDLPGAQRARRRCG
jgi:hypothetical protein